MAKVTVHDIAKVLGISASTVSRALNDHPKISKRTKESVYRTAKEMGYNAGVGLLQTTKRNLVVLIIPNQESAFIRQTVKILNQQIQQKGFRLLVFQTYEKYEDEKGIVGEIVELRPSGVIVALSSESPNAKHFRAICEHEIPVVFFYRVDYNFEAPRVVIDNYSAAYKATQHLIENGFRRIAHLAGPPHSSVYAEIVSGYKKALSDNRIEFRDDFLIYSDLTNEDARECMRRLYGPGTQPNAIFAASNNVSLQALQFLKNNGIRVPKQVGVLSYGYDPAGAFFSPSISTIEQPADEIAASIYKILSRIMEDDTVENKTYIHSAKLIIRTSTLPV